MPSLIRRLRASGKLQAAALKADKAIQDLNEMHGADTEVVGVLVSYYEDLRKRYQHLKDFERSRPESEEQGSDEPALHQLQENKDGDKDEDEQTPTRPVCIDQLEDGTLRFTLPPKEPNDEPEVYILSSADYDKKDPIHNVIITANELIRIAAEAITSNGQLLRESQLEFLANIQEGLHAQKNKIDLLLGSGGSPLAIEVAAKLYLDDAFRYFQNSRLLLQDLNGVDFDDIGKSKLRILQSRLDCS